MTAQDVRILVQARIKIADLTHITGDRPWLDNNVRDSQWPVLWRLTLTTKP